MEISLAFSPCPNDTFIFDALVNKKIDTQGINFKVHLEDVETLNQWALQEKTDCSKISYGVLPLLLNKYKVLQSGGALGKGVGPLLISKNQQPFNSEVHNEVVIPGEHTTAHFLFSLAYPHAKNKKFLTFNAIESYVLNNPDSFGVIIHENRFTYQQKGLTKIIDLGQYWEQQTNLPIPLGGIVIHNRIDVKLATTINSLIQQSVEFAFANYPALSAYVFEHAQEMEENVIRQHINLYVNQYSVQLKKEGEHAVLKLLQVYHQLHQKDAALQTDNIFLR